MSDSKDMSMSDSKDMSMSDSKDMSMSDSKDMSLVHRHLLCDLGFSCCIKNGSYVPGPNLQFVCVSRRLVFVLLASLRLSLVPSMLVLFCLKLPWQRGFCNK